MFILSTDIDGTVYDGPETASHFADFWQKLCQASPLPRPILAYNSGRGLSDVLNLLGESELPKPDFIIGGVGTELYDFELKSPLDGWGEELSEGWDFERVEVVVQETFPSIQAQPKECQNKFKCSWFWHDSSNAEIQRLGDALSSAGLNAQVVYSSNRDLDVLPAGANKGNAVAWLVQKRKISLPIVVAGDSGNDASMFLVEGVEGILVSNAEEALTKAVEGKPIFRASSPCAYGVTEGLANIANRNDSSQTDISSANPK